METRFLKTLLSVIDANSIAAAARKENLTPSAVVQRLRALEDEIGAPLVRRAGHSMRATEAGTAVIDIARRIVEMAESLPGLANQNEEIGRVRVGPCMVELDPRAGLLPEILTSMKEKRPGYRLRPAARTVVGVLFQRMIDGNLDAAILVEPPVAISRSLHGTSFVEIRAPLV